MLKIFKALFGGNRPVPAAPPTPPLTDTVDRSTAAQVAAYRAMVAGNLRTAAEESERFRSHYGEWERFLHQPDFDNFLRGQVLYFWEPGEANKTFLDKSHWAYKHPFNFPGPFYAGESDTCGTGIDQAPANVVIDSMGCEYVFRQPADYYELLCVLNAAAIEVFDSYSSDGNHHWTYQACRQWWRNRSHLLHDLSRPETIAANNGQAQRYAEYLRGAAELDLRRYCYFLENGVYPPAGLVALPVL